MKARKRARLEAEKKARRGFSGVSSGGPNRQTRRFMAKHRLFKAPVLHVKEVDE